MKIVLALGGNALGNTPTEQLRLVHSTAKAIADLVESGHTVVIGHGNGPQVGMINVAFEAANEEGTSPLMPFPECGAMSQGYIGYHLVQALKNELNARNIKKDVACIVTQVEVDKNDDAFKHPSKPIGTFMDKADADRLTKETGYTYVEDSGRGYRRVVPSPLPKSILEINTINALIERDEIVITVGGGGIPVVMDGNSITGVAAVIDKDMSCALLAKEINADMLIVLTAVDYVCINYGKKDQKELKHLTAKEAQEYMNQGQFGKGSMLPKIIACTDFAKSGKTAVITSLENAKDALNAGTVITG